MHVRLVIQRGLAALVFIALLAFAFEFCRRAGERGFFSLDQSIEFDGAYRILRGQVPYRDFLIPTGPMVFWLQAVVFWLAGVSWGSFVLGAAVINVVATVLAMGVLRTLFPDRRPLASIGGLLTATWFYPPYGTPNMEQTAFLFSFVGLASCLAAVCGQRLAGARYAALLMLTGGCAVVSLLSKQNAGGLFAPLYPLLLAAVLGNQRRRIAAAAGWMGLGAALVGIAFGTWLIWQSDPALFYEHAIEIPRRLGRSRLLSYSMLREVAGGRVFEPVRLAMAACGLFAALAAVSGFRLGRKDSPSDRRAFAALTIGVYLPLYQNAFRGCTLNQWQECQPFAGVILAGAIGIGLARLAETSRRSEMERRAGGYREGLVAGLLIPAAVVISVVTKMPIPAAAAVLAVIAGWGVGLFPTPCPGTETPGGALVRRIGGRAPHAVGMCLAAVLVGHVEYRGLRDSWDRTVHDIFAGSHFGDYSRVPGLARLKWGMPTSVHGVDTTDEQMVQLVDYLRQEGKPFFVFPDMTMLYGIVGKTSPQPLLWFHHGLTYPLRYEAGLDRRIVDSLEQNGVEIVVLQNAAWFGNASEQLAHFPILEAYVRDGFSRVSNDGPFEVRQKPLKDRAYNARGAPPGLPSARR
jgi:hypothetical protein